MLADVVPYLACPHCRGSVALDGRTVRCDSGHAFDVARQGYVNLRLGGARRGTAAGDTAAMVSARDAFLGAGHYGGLAARVAEVAARLETSACGADSRGCVVELGAGTGYYLAHVLDRLPARVGLALDVSPYAARRAARAHPRLGSVVGDAWQALPVRDAAASLVLDVFAPRNGQEIARVLRPGGALVVVTPSADHLGELVGALGLLTVDARKADRVADTLGPYVDAVDRQGYAQTLRLGHLDVQNLVAMGPSAWHAEPEALRARIRALPDPVQVTLSVTLSTYRRG